MLKAHEFYVSFQEVPDELTIAINISGCPNRCPGCHSPWLWSDEGEFLDSNYIDRILEPYKDSVTCICFMGGDQAADNVVALATYVRETLKLKAAWYTGREQKDFNEDFFKYFDYIKIGPYKKDLGGLDSKTTNQQMIKVFGLDHNLQEDITCRFWDKGPKFE